MGLERSIFVTSELHTLDRLLCAVGRRMARSDFAELVGHFVMPQSHSCHLHPPVLLFFSKMHSSVPSNPCPVHLLFHWVPPCLTQRCVICSNCAAVVPTWPWGQSSAKIQLSALHERDLPPSLVLCCCLLPWKVQADVGRLHGFKMLLAARMSSKRSSQDWAAA